MCLILLAWHAHPEFPLVFAGNRDEAYDRPSTAAEFWNDAPEIFGGRDLDKGGTWLGVTTTGRIAAVTNYRDGPTAKDAPRSRGELTADFLRSIDAPRAYLERVIPDAGQFRGFSLIVGDQARLYSMSNRAAGTEEIAAGVHGLSNHLLNTPWPKVVRGKRRLSGLLKADEADLTAGLFAILSDRTIAPDAELPDTGVGLQRERELSPAFVAGERYGTRASTVLLITSRGEVVLVERRFGALGVPQGETVRRFPLQDMRASGRVTKAAGQDV